MRTYRTALVGCSRMGAFIDNEVPVERGPYSHAAGYEACDRTEMVACSDLREDVMEKVGERYNVPKERQYVDYKEMIDKEQPDILSVATQPEHRAEIVVYAAQHGVRAIYAEKAMAASMADADAMVEAVEKNGVLFNMGTNRRWDPGYDAMVEVIESGRIGKLKSVVSHTTGTLFNTASHIFDLLMRLNGDQAATWVQAFLHNGNELIEGEHLTNDPMGQGTIQFENGVTAYALNSGRGLEVEAIGEKGCVTALGTDREWRIREVGETDHRGRGVWEDGVFPDFERKSSTLRLIEDLVNGLDTGEATRCGVRLARANNELIFAFVESHTQGGKRVELPLGESDYFLKREWRAREPKFER
jgi:predicted dehydrogenase